MGTGPQWTAITASERIMAIWDFILGFSLLYLALLLRMSFPYKV